MVGVGLGLLVEDTSGIESVNTDIAGGVDDATIAEANTDMDDASLVVLEEAEVVLFELLE